MAAWIDYAAEGGPEYTSNPPTATYALVAGGTASESVVRSLAAAFAPATILWEGNLLDQLNVTLKPKGNACTVWEVTVSYGIKFHQKITFDTSGGSQKISLPLNFIENNGSTAICGHTRFRWSKPSGNTDEPFNPEEEVPPNKLINNGEGIDIIVPAFNFTVTMQIPKVWLTSAYFLVLRMLTGCTNAGLFNGFAPGEVLFLGASGGIQESEDTVEIEYKFSCSPNTTFEVPGITNELDPKEAIPGPGTVSSDKPSKDGWDYVWFLTKQGEKDAAGNDLSFRQETPIGLYIDKVYRPGNFNLLGLGL